MKLQELAAQAQTKQVAKVMESYFDTQVDFHKLSRPQARNMLNRVRAVMREHRRNPSFHSSEKNPAYLKLLMMEQGLSGRISEQMPVIAGDPAKQAALASAQMAQKKRDLQDQIKSIDDQIKSLQLKKGEMQRAMNMPTMEARRLAEASEVQQAQVILASKDMVDQVQKMIEQTTAIQFKDLPALVDQIRNEVGYDQATQFNTDATAALSGMVQNLQGAKGQLEVALGVVTGQAPQVPGADMATEPAPTVPEVPAGQEQVDIDAEADIEEPSDLETSLGRGKR